MNDKKMVVIFSVEGNEDSIDRGVKFLQRAIEDYREDGMHSGGQYAPERLAMVGGLKEVIGARLLERGEEIVTVKPSVTINANDRKGEGKGKN